jgi:hypothetical protein
MKEHKSLREGICAENLAGKAHSLEKQLIWQKVTSIRNVWFSRLGVVWRIGTHIVQKKFCLNPPNKMQDWQTNGGQI